MTFRVRYPFVIMLLAMLLFIGGAVYAYYTGYFIIESVEVIPDEYRTSFEKTGVRPGQNIIFLQIDKMVSGWSGGRLVESIDLHYDLPDAVSITVKKVMPIVLALDPGTGRMVGLDHNCRVLPYDEELEMFPYPLVTGLKDLRHYEPVADSNLTLLMGQLCRLKEQNAEIFSSISSIDLASQDSATLFVDGLNFPVVTYPGRLFDGLERLNYFLASARVPLKEIIYLDLRSQDQIIAKRKECPKQKS